MTCDAIKLRAGAQERVADTRDYTTASVPVRANGAPLNGKRNIRGRPYPQDYTITSGRETIGFVHQTNRAFAAMAADGRRLGVFPSMKAAADAISERCNG
jgi:hypothetical protein